VQPIQNILSNSLVPPTPNQVDLHNFGEARWRKIGTAAACRGQSVMKSKYNFLCMKAVVLAVNADDKNAKICHQKALDFHDSYFKFFSPLRCNQYPSWIFQQFLSALLYTATNAHLALLAHVASRNMRAVSDTFRRRNFPPHPPRKPNMNEYRSHNNMLGPIRSPPPAAN
jgi:hypothetical protein